MLTCYFDGPVFIDQQVLSLEIEMQNGRLARVQPIHAKHGIFGEQKTSLQGYKKENKTQNGYNMKARYSSTQCVWRACMKNLCAGEVSVTASDTVRIFASNKLRNVSALFF